MKQDTFAEIASGRNTWTVQNQYTKPRLLRVAQIQTVMAATTASMGSPQMGKWLVNSGASSHMIREKALLTDCWEFEKPERVVLGDGRTVEAVGVGNAHLNMLL